MAEAKQDVFEGDAEAEQPEYSASSHADIKANERDVADREKDIDWVMSTPRGRRFLHNLIFNDCHIEANSFVPGAADSTGYNEGIRNLGVLYHRAARLANPRRYVEMLGENDDVMT